MDSESAQMQQQHHSPGEPVKVTRGHSCVLCQQRKVRCDKNKPCANCVKAQVECRVVPPQPPRRRKKKLSERDLVERVRRYESLLAENGIDFDASGIHGSSHGDELAELESDLGALRTGNAATRKLFQYDRDFSMHEELIHDSSGEDDYQGSSIHQAYDKMFDDADAFPFAVTGRPEKITDLHPPAVQIFQLWNVYLNNVNPLLKITHTPTLQGKIIEAATNLTKVPKATEALMFSIYLMATISLTQEECMTTFNESKNALLGRYHTGAQQALVNAEFMRTNDITVLQAYLLYLLGIRWYIDPRSLFCLIGIAVRTAHRLGLHRDGEQYKLSPFDVEMRRRLWWQIVTFDKRIGEMTGSTITALTHGADTKLPLNINDADLHVDSKDPPTPYTGPTEMMFALTRVELVNVVRIESSASAATGGSFAPGRGYPGKGPAGTSSGVTVDFAANLMAQRPKINLDAFCQYMEDKYLRHCDAKVPFHLFTILMTRQALWKMRVIHYMVQDVEAKRAAAVAAKTPSSTPSSVPGTPSVQQQQQHAPGSASGSSGSSAAKSPSPTVGGANRDAALLTAIHTLEADNTLHTSPSLKGYHWCVLMHLPFPSYMFLIHELRHTTSGELCERAWRAIEENHERRRAIMTMRNPMHIAMGHLFVKAWDARVAADRAAGREEPECPFFIKMLKEHMAKYGTSRLGGEKIPALPLGQEIPHVYHQPPNHGVLVPGREADNEAKANLIGNRSRGIQFGNAAAISAAQQKQQQQRQQQQGHFQQPQQQHPAVHSAYSMGSGMSTSGVPTPGTAVESPPPAIMDGLDMFGSDGMGQFFGTGEFGGGFGDVDWSLMLPPEFGGTGGGGGGGAGGGSGGGWGM